MEENLRVLALQIYVHKENKNAILGIPVCLFLRIMNSGYFLLKKAFSSTVRAPLHEGPTDVGVDLEKILYITSWGSPG